MKYEVNKHSKIQNNVFKWKITYLESDKGGILLSWSKLDVFSKHANLLELIVLEFVLRILACKNRYSH